METYSRIKSDSPKQNKKMSFQSPQYCNPNQILKSKPKDPNYLNQGIPNSKNHCFLICLIQMLYGYQKFRKKVLESSSKKEIVILLKNIFSAIQNDATKNQKDKRNIIQQIAQYLQRNDSDFKNGMQDDSTYFFLKIADEIQEQKEFQNIFTFQYSLECPKNKLHYPDSAMDKILPADMKCPKCKTLLKLSLQKDTNCYVRRERKKQMIKQKINYRNNSNQLFTYKICGQILYCGSGTSGHYISTRVITQNKKQKIFMFDDLNVKQLSTLDYSIFKPILSLYVRSRNQQYDYEVATENNYAQKQNEAIYSLSYCCCSWTICCPCFISQQSRKNMTDCCYACLSPVCACICCQYELFKENQNNNLNYK